MSTQLIEVEKIEPVTEPGQAYPASVVLASGRVVGSPERVSFVVDARTAHDLRLTLEANPGSLLIAVVEPWQMIVGRN